VALLAAAGIAAGWITAGRFGAAGFRARVARGYLGAGITCGNLGASFVVAAATVQPEHAVEEFEAEPLAA